jgi:ATP-binding cassette subfamily B protein
LLQLNHLSLKLNAWSGLSSTLFLSGLILLTGNLYFQESIKAGTFLAVLGISSNLLPSVLGLSLAFLPYQEAKVAFQRMFTFVQNQQSIKQPNQESLLKVDFENLEANAIKFRFPGSRVLFENLSFSIKKGETLSILGKNGSGKSTLLQILQGFYAIESGKICINGYDLTQLDLTYWQSQIAIVPQDVKIFNASLFENITLQAATPESYDKITHYLSSLGFDVFINSLPFGYETYLGENEGFHLSGGQKQLLALARALCKFPKILLLDEFDSALDTDAENLAYEIIEKVKSDLAIVLITHKEVNRMIIDKTVRVGGEILYRMN